MHIMKHLNKILVEIYDDFAKCTNPTPGGGTGRGAASALPVRTQMTILYLNDTAYQYCVCECILRRRQRTRSCVSTRSGLRRATPLAWYDRRPLKASESNSARAVCIRGLLPSCSTVPQQCAPAC